MTDKKTPKEAQEEYAKAIATELITMIKAGTAPWQRPWTPAQGRDIPYNHITGQDYRGSNNLYLWMQHRDDPRWMTYKQAQSVDAQVRKWEKGTRLIKLITHTERVKLDENGKVMKDKNGEPLKEVVKLKQPFVKGFTVFNAEQIEGLPRLERLPLPDMQWNEHNTAERILIASGAEIEHRPGNKAFYSPMRDRIVLPDKAQFTDAGSYYATALHELGHWTGHPGRLDRDLSGNFGSESYAKEELRAEISSMMVNRQLGIPHDPSRHAAYVESWVKVLESDPLEILHASRDAQKIQDYVLAFQQRDIQQQPQPTTSQAETETISPEGRLQRAKDSYHIQNHLLTTPERQMRQVREYGMEKMIAGLPEELKTEARTNFYENEIKAAIQLVDVPKSPTLFEDNSIDR